MPDLQKLQSDKEKILSTLRSKGPSFPARISRDIGISPLFVSALLSELLSEKKVKISNMKVGSSPIYMIPGQESKLEDFSQYLNSRETEAFNLLKEKEILEDEKQSPVARVALRAIKDFAIPINVKVKGESKLFWKFFTSSDETAKEKIQEVVVPQTPKPSATQEKPKTSTQELKENEITPAKTQTSPTPVVAPEEEEETIQHSQPKKPEKPKPVKEHEFSLQIKDYLTAKDVEVLEDLLNKKKEFVSRVRIDTLFGKQEYYMTAKEKKKVSEQDLAIAVQKAQSEKMPALFISPGEPDKNAKEYLKNWKNLIKFEKISL